MKPSDLKKKPKESLTGLVDGIVCNQKPIDDDDDDEVQIVIKNASDKSLVHLVVVPDKDGESSTWRSVGHPNSPFAAVTVPSKRRRSSDKSTALSPVPVDAQDPFMTYWKSAWGKPLSIGLTALPNSPPLKDGDILSEEPVMIGVDSREFLVRAEYIRMYDFVDDHFTSDHPDLGSAVAVTGQPGIGEDLIIMGATWSRAEWPHWVRKQWHVQQGGSLSLRVRSG